jgi:hypothetical protein
MTSSVPICPSAPVTRIFFISKLLSKQQTAIFLIIEAGKSV